MEHNESYTIVDKPAGMDSSKSWGKWRQLFDPLPEGKAVKFDCADRKEANHLGATLCQTTRATRHISYRLHYRKVPNGTGISLYVWKEARSKSDREAT